MSEAIISLPAKPVHQSALKTADELTPPSVAEGMTARIRETFAQGKRAVPDTHLVEQTDRVLLAQRRYQKRIVFGAPHLRCLICAIVEAEGAERTRLEAEISALVRSIAEHGVHA